MFDAGLKYVLVVQLQTLLKQYSPLEVAHWLFKEHALPLVNLLTKLKKKFKQNFL